MKLLKFSFDHLYMFMDGVFSLDLFAEDRVPATDESVHRVRNSLFTNNVIAFAGINASGKSTSLILTDFALDLLSGVAVNSPGTGPFAVNFFNRKTTMQAVVYAGEELFLVVSHMQLKDAPISYSVSNKVFHTFTIEDEEIYKLPKSISKKDLIKGFDHLRSVATLVFRRSEMEETLKKLLGEDRSAFVLFNGNPKECITIGSEDMGFSLPDNAEDAVKTLRVFDSSILSMKKRKGSNVIELEFEGRSDPLRLPADSVESVLSSGTIKGFGLARFILDTLKEGGYLLLDEIENHLNKTLVQMMIGLFANDETNPKGATLIFTTHYPEILDCIHRKDDVYFLTRSTHGKIEVIKYSDRATRIENKKSEVFISNHIKGTAPKYSEIARFKELARKVAQDGAAASAG